MVTKAKGKKAAPSGFAKIEPVLLKFQEKLKEAESRPVQLNRPKNESHWEIIRLHHQRSRYVFDAYYKKKIISKELFLWLVKYKYVDKDLIAKWKKQGYEKLCCVGCINGEKVCVCRVPRSDRDGEGGEGRSKVECVTCGCHGCSSVD